MLRTLRQIFVTALTILTITLLALWWRSHHTIDVLQLHWQHVNPQCARLISNSGGLHLEYTTLRPLNGLRASREWNFSVRSGNDLSPEIRCSTSIAHFALRTEFQIRVPLQDLFEDEARTRPIYQSQTIPLKIVSAPFWFIVLISGAIPLLSFLLWMHAPRRPRSPSRILWLLRRPALLATMGTILLSLAWLRSGWRSDALEWATRDGSCFLHISGGQVSAMLNERPTYHFDDPERAPVQLSISVALARANDWVVAPVAGGREGIAVPFWLLVMISTATALTLYLRQHLAPVYPPGHCAHCGYDLRASTGRCPECGSTGKENPRQVSRKRITLAVWAGTICLLMTAVLLVGWYRSRSQSIWLFRHDGPRRMLTVTQSNQLEFRSFWRDTGGGMVQYLDLPWYLAPSGCAVAGVACLWIARRNAKPPMASTSPSAS